MVTEIRYETAADNIPALQGKVIFMAGCTVRGNQPHLTSWRFDFIEEFKRQNFNGTLIIPEFTDRKASDKGKKWIPIWEFTGLRRADVIMFWIPRTRELIGLTTNWEHGYWVARKPNKLVYGRPDDSYRNGYIDVMWDAALEDVGYTKQPIYTTMKETVAAAIELATTPFQTLPSSKGFDLIYPH